MDESVSPRAAGRPGAGRGKRLGDIMVEANLITRDQLETALSQQQPSGPLLGQILMDMGLVTEADVARALAHQLGLPYLDEADLAVDVGTARRLSPISARRYAAVPLREDGDALLVAMTDPMNILAIDDITFSTGREVRPVVVTGATLEKALVQAYGGPGGEAAGAPREARPGPPEAAAARPSAPPGAPVRPEPPAAAGLATGEEAPIIRLINSVLDRAIAERSSDVHMEPLADRVRVRYRIDGVLYDVMSIPLADHAACVSRIKIMASMDISERRIPQDGRIQLKDDRRDVDLRVSTLPTIFGEKAAIRILDKSQAITSLEQLGLSPAAMAAYLRMVRQAYGMILVTGPTGSGKTTTLMATLRRLNEPGKNIITIEDPVEYQVDGVNQVQVNPKAGLTFATGLRSILRQDPNIIMVGEVRDRETADIAIRSALTGHLVLSSMHTNNAAGALTRLLDWGVEPFLVASSVIGSVAQRLVRTVCPRCRQPRPLAEDAPERLPFNLPPGTLEVWEGKGCQFCGQSGYRGRTGLFEVLRMSPALRDLVTAKSSAGAIDAQAVAEGLVPLVEDGVEKALQGVTDLGEVQRVAFYEER